MGRRSFNEEETFSALTTMFETLRKIFYANTNSVNTENKLTLYGICIDKAVVLSYLPAAVLQGILHIPQHLYSGHPLRKENEFRTIKLKAKLCEC